MKNKLVVIAGPTATGKSAWAVAAAEALGGEVVSADSMLVYRGMDIGTAKPTRAEKRGIPHHLIDVVEPDEEYSVAVYQKQARECIGRIMAKGVTPILAGGTGLYIRAVIDGYEFTDAQRDEKLRSELLAEAERGGAAALHRRLAEVDENAAARFHPNDTRRVTRALEVYYLTGRPLSASWRLNNGEALYDLLFLGLTLDRAELYQRIENRVDAMIENGLIEEVRGLREVGYGAGLTSMRGLGYKEILAYLAGTVGKEEAITLLKRNTRRFAKRQLTWFRRDRRIKWLPANEPPALQEITDWMKS